MYPSNGIQDTSLFLFSDNMYSNPSSTYEGFPSSSLFNVFPSSHLVDFNDEAVLFQDFHGILHQQGNGQEMDQEMVIHEGASNTNMSNIDVKKKILSGGGSSELREQIRVKRRCHKDRHSKITTANGSSRGRRMRLSLNVAKEFFALQDMLEFDKASKTVAWLLKKSESAIKEETAKLTGMSHSPCPSTSAIDELEPDLEAGTSKEKARGTQKVSATLSVTRGLREKARARARERTQKKKQLQLGGGFTDNDRSRLYNRSQGMNIGSDHPLLNCEKSAAACNKFLNMRNTDPALVLEVEDILNYSKQQPHSLEGKTNTEELTFDHSFFVTNNWDPYTFFNLHNNSMSTFINSHPSGSMENHGNDI
ncbi:TCP domain-containing protein [Heracleum sosnowskyi]|uniref:TCP domain-containing protein n=1 Tax=Heracleum sosnowskyi TaxID=360622 RepID=A0AAD8HTR4_9APIA|nr:TCP domain-containing protein [Heracleum sosnowskyi]